jgi:sucrose-phosphate synthase
MIIHLYNIHGLIRSGNLEIGRDSDNGGQLIYLMELARTLSKHEKVTFVHIFTRKIDDPKFDSEYSIDIEPINEKCDIRRVQCGGKRYLPKEKLWAHLDEFVTNSISHIKKHKIVPDWIHSHYADAGYVAAEVARYLNVPFAHTGHSLGIPKQQELLKTGATQEELERIYNFEKRFFAENQTLSHAEFIVTSTTQEISTYTPYQNHDKAIFHPIAPGIDFDKFYPYYEDELDVGHSGMNEKKALYDLHSSIKLFLSNPEKPVILALSRPDKKKNIQGLIHAYGTDKELQALANLAIFAGVRKDINTMPQGERETLTEILLLMDKYNLYGKIAIPKKTGSPNEIPALYRYCASRHGIFVNVALQENFGLTTLEAASSGMPVVVTEVGGPSEVVERCQNGFAVDPTSTKAIQKALRSILISEDEWKRLSDNGLQKVREEFSWETHVNQYMDIVQENLLDSSGEGKRRRTQHEWNFSSRLKKANDIIISDIDGTLVYPEGDNPGLDDFKKFLANRSSHTLFGLATGRNLELSKQIIEEYNLPTPDVLILSVGTQILYSLTQKIGDNGWHSFIQYRWNPERIENLLLNVKGIKKQGADSQSDVKLSYFVEDNENVLEEIKAILDKDNYNVNITLSHNRYLDIIPRRASKGRAIRYLARKFNIPLNHVYTCGDSGNDSDMISGPMSSIVVSNYSEELEPFKSEKNTYFASQPAAAGVLEGLRHYGVLKDN